MQHALRFAVALATWVGCKSVYAPNMANVPILEQEGQLSINADSRNLQAAYAVTDEIGLMANAYFRDYDETLDSGERQEGRGGLFEFAAGHGRSVAKLHPWLRLHTFAGIGAGDVSHEITRAEETTPRQFSANGVRGFVMPALGFSRTYVDAGISARVVALRFSDVKNDNYTTEALMGDRFAGLDERTWYFIEPAVTVRAGYKWVKLQLQIGHSYKLNTTEMNHDEGMNSLGLHLDLFRRFE